MRVKYFVPALAAGAAAASETEKTPLTFSEFYGDTCKAKSKSYTWVGSVPIDEEAAGATVPQNTYRGYRKVSQVHVDFSHFTLHFFTSIFPLFT